MSKNKDAFDKRYAKELAFDLPIVVNGLPIYPIKIRDIFMYMYCIGVLKIKKDFSLGIKVIKMNKIQHMLYLIDEHEEKEMNRFLFLFLIKLSVGEIESIEFGVDENKQHYLEINGVKFFDKEFIQLRETILFRNDPNFTDRYIDPELEKELKEAERLRNNGMESVSIEEHILSLNLNTSLSIEVLQEYSVRKFVLLFKMIDKQLSYTILKTASYSGNVTFKEDIPHFLEYKKTGVLDGKIMDVDTLKQKINKKR